MPAPPGNQYALGNPGGGAPAEYDPKYHPKTARNLSLLGLTNIEIAKSFGITERAFYKWKDEHEEFRSALLEAETADSKVAVALFKRARGYVRNGEYYPPDVRAIRYWLNNRNPEKWRERQHLTIEDPDEVLASVLGVNKEELPE